MTEELLKRLEATRVDQYRRGAPTVPVQPDGPEAAALIRSLAADRDKAVGLLREWANARTVSQAGQAKTATDAFLSSQTEGR